MASPNGQNQYAQNCECMQGHGEQIYDIGNAVEVLQGHLMRASCFCLGVVLVVSALALPLLPPPSLPSPLRGKFPQKWQLDNWT